MTTATKHKYRSKKKTKQSSKSPFISVACVKSLHTSKIESRNTPVTTIILYKLILKKTFLKNQIFKFNFMTLVIQKIQCHDKN